MGVAVGGVAYCRPLDLWPGGDVDPCRAQHDCKVLAGHRGGCHALAPSNPPLCGTHTQPFYFNPDTGDSSWILPVAGEGQERPVTPADVSTAAAAFGSTEAAEAAQSDTEGVCSGADRVGAGCSDGDGVAVVQVRLVSPARVLVL